jgi:hypothetical protein
LGLGTCLYLAYQGDLYNMYYKQFSSFIASPFSAFESLFECKYENIQIKWIIDFNFGTEHLAFENNQHIWVVHRDLKAIIIVFVTKDVFVVIESSVKN